VMGSEFGLPVRGLSVTFEDMTVAQAIRLEDFPQPREAIARFWMGRQHANYRRVAACCVASHWAADSIVADYGIPRSKIRVVGFGRNIEIEPVERDWSSPRYLFVGLDWQRKNGPGVVAAFAEVRRRFPTAELHLVGDHPRLDQPGVVGHGRVDLEHRADRAALVRLFERATCFVMPSRYEPFGIAYAEAGGAGVPSIASSVGGARDAVGSGGGLFVAPDDQRSLVDAFLTLADPVRAREMGMRAADHAALLTWRRVAARICAALGLAIESELEEPQLTRT
jgi:glycosyltransferase involved in cell wall biosynthesis